MQVLQDHPREEPSDVALLSSFAARADALAAQTTATSYTARVREVSALCCQIVTRLHAPPGPAAQGAPALPDAFWDLNPAVAADAGWDPTAATPGLSASMPAPPDSSLFLDPAAVTPSFGLGPGVFADPGQVMFDSLLDSFAGPDPAALGLMP